MNNHQNSLNLSKTITEKICRDLEVETPKEWGDSIRLWYGSTLVKSEWFWYVTGDKDRLKKDILHILEHF